MSTRRGSGLSRSAQIATVGVFAVLTAAFAGYTVAHDQEPPTNAAAESWLATHSPAPDIDDPGVTPPAKVTTLADVRRLVLGKELLVVSVLGDSTGNADDEWVHLWAEHLAETRAVTYHAWDDVAKKYLPAQTLSTSGPRTVIWNAAAPGRTASYPAQYLGRMEPEEPQVVIYNFGHNNTQSNFRDELETTMDAVARRWGSTPPSVAILQNPETGDTAAKHQLTIETLRDSVAPTLGLATIDVWRAFEAANGPLSALVSNADGLGVHPSPAGSKVWAAAVTAAIG